MASYLPMTDLVTSNLPVTDPVGEQQNKSFYKLHHVSHLKK